MKKAAMGSKFNKMTVLYYNSLFSAIAMVVFFGAEDLYHVQSGHSSILGQSAWLGIVSTHAAVEATTATTATAGRYLEASSSPSLPVQNSLAQSTLFSVSLYPYWDHVDFWVIFLTASLLGSILNYAIFLCTTHNSALTTAVIGCLKNVLTAYAGMLLFSDYSFNWLNFIGVNISIAGSLYYTYLTMVKGVSGYGGGG
jgi:hypothetical protein